MLRWTPYCYRIPAAMRKQVWLMHAKNKGRLLCKCCEENIVTPFDFQCAHIVAESKGGKTHISNLVPACKLCNQSMGTTNFYVFKTLLQSQQFYDIEKMDNTQKQVINYYMHMAKNMTINTYYKNFNQWTDILAKSMRVTKIRITDPTPNDKPKNDFYENKVKCKCGYKFVYLTSNDDFALTCKNNKQNIIDVICDHIPCLINNPDFIKESNYLRIRWN